MGKEKSYEGQCSSYVRRDDKLVRCENQGERRTDNSLDSGIHCDSCWSDMLVKSRSRSW